MRGLPQFHKLRKSRLRLFFIISAVIFIYLSCGLFYRQLVQYQKFRQKEKQQNLRKIIIPGTRGNIYDRNGILLAGHKNLFSINLCLHELNDEFKKEYLRRVNALRDENIKFHAVDLRRQVKEDIVNAYLNTVNGIIGSNFKISGKNVENHLSQHFLLPWKIANNLTRQEFDKLIYFLPKDFPIQVVIDDARFYPYKDLACHVLGYVVMEERRYDGRSPDDGENIKTFVAKRQTGKTGVEFTKDDVLRGEPGYELWQVDTFGRHREMLETRLPKHGGSVILSIDKTVQQAAERALSNNRGCAIVMNVKTGEILAMASKPSYDINLLIPRIYNDIYDQITSQSGWLNLATQGQFPPGSVFKLVSSIAFLKSKLVLPTDSVFCEGITKIGDRKFRCKNHPWGIKISFEDAIARSCNTFFYENSQKVKKDRLIKEAIELGFSEKTGIELPYECSGFVPTEAWKKKRGYGSWMIGDTINLSIGQGYLLVTPLEICCFTSSIAMNRLRTKPTIFLNGNNGNLPNIPDLGLSDDDRKFLINSMVEVVEHRSGIRAKLDNLKIAGKTGTAQFFVNGEKRNLAWFTCFAPVDVPEIAVTVMVQEQSKDDAYFGGRHSAPIAKEILKTYFSKK